MAFAFRTSFSRHLRILPLKTVLGRLLSFEQKYEFLTISLYLFPLEGLIVQLKLAGRHRQLFSVQVHLICHSFMQCFYEGPIYKQKNIDIIVVVFS